MTTKNHDTAELRLIIETIPAVVWSALPDGSVDFINQRLVESTGVSRETLLGSGWGSVVHPDELARFADEWRAAQAAGEPMGIEARVRQADGSYRWWLIRNVPLRDEVGRITKWYGTSVDIEDRKRAEAELRASEQQWRDVFENNPTMYFMVDAAGTVLLVNPFGAEQLGYTVNELVGQDVMNVFDPPDREAVRRNVAACFGQLGRAKSWEARKVRKDGMVIWVRETAKAVPRANGPIVLIACEDITERKRAEQTLEDLAGRLITAQEAERSRIGRELHDHISQMLGVLTIKIDQVRDTTEITPAVGGALEELRRHTSDITDDVHRLSHRLHSSTLDYLGLVPALQKLVSEFSKRHEFSITFAHASMPASLPSDVALCLFRIAEESLTNVAKHSQAGSARVHMTGAPDGLHLRVEDAGTGFDMTTLESKAGLGFVSMQERLRLLHGTLHIDSAPSRGTRIDAWVPSGMLTGDRNDAAPRSETA